jgi:sodium/bile acid cotransporter 7
MSSQKSAPVAVTVISYIASDPAVQGLLAIPCVVGQISQIFVGSAFVRHFARQVEEYKRQQQQQQQHQPLEDTAVTAAALSSSQGQSGAAGSAADLESPAVAGKA